jgi:energy-converting hydrogenase A subunit R
VIVSDWEGPWVIADHAFEVTKNGIPNGEKLFSIISEYDDYLAYIKKKPGYEPGDTLALIVPFLIAYNLDSSFLLNVAKCNANFIEGALEAIKVLKDKGHSLKIISTSYCPYVYYTTSLAGIPKTDVKCTLLEIDKYLAKINEKDKNFVRKKAEIISRHPKLNISATTNLQELSEDTLEIINELDTFFWEELPKTSFNEVLYKIKPLGGNRKYLALLKFLEEANKGLNECTTIGDSITDWVILKNTKASGGLAVSFNGNEYAIRNSNVALISETCLLMPIIIDLFFNKGLFEVKKLTSNWTYENVKKAVESGWIDSSLFNLLLKSLTRSSKKEFPLAIWINDHNLGDIIKKSLDMRKKVRGATVGSLG